MVARLRTVADEQSELKRRECERRLIGRWVGLAGYRWRVQVVDQHEETADLHGGDLVLKGVPLVDAVSADECICGQHGGARG